MEEKEVKKKFSILKLLIVLIVLYMIGCFIYLFLKMPINNIYIENNTYLSDQEVIDSAKISSYPSFYLTPSHKIKNNLLKNEFISSAKVSKSFGRIVTIKIEENTPLFIYKDKVMLSNGKSTDKDYILPIVTNTMDDKVLSKLIEKYKLLNEEIKIMISEIKYDPNKIDSERFLITMNDGNYAYITLYKMSVLNDYIKIQNTLENKKGILYLDSGNYFEIFK